MRAFVEDLMNQLRVADALDITVTAALLYILFAWLRDRASRSLGLVALALSSLFLLSRWLDMYLTTMMFRYGIVGILVAMVVVFQHDIRHGVERLASSRWFCRTSVEEPSRQTADTIVDAVIAMADQRIGALIVFPGRQPLDCHVRGGVQVDARISTPLLLSIFYPDSSGHDGAVLIERERIKSLGLHLPLTKQVHKVHDCGTRHAAALGLAECCDALIVVVSEERGTITVAKMGSLVIVEPTELADQLRQYFHSQTDPIEGQESDRLSRWATKFGAIGVAVALWFAFAYHTDIIQRTFVLPIEYRNLPNGLEIDEPKPTYAEATLSGPEQAFALLNPAAIAVSLKIDEAQGHEVLRWQTATNLVNVPAELEIVRIKPDTVVVSVRPKAKE